MITFDQIKAMYAKIDNLQQAGVKITALEIYPGLDEEMVVNISTTGQPAYDMIDGPADARYFIVSQYANIRPQHQDHWLPEQIV